MSYSEAAQHAHRPQQRRVLLTGASGFVGSHVAQLLLAEGWEVHAIARSAAARARVASAAPGATLHEGDLSDGVALRRAAQGCSVAINCAAVYRWWLREPSQYQRANVDGVGVLLRAASAAGVQRVVQVSTILAFGCPPGYGTADLPLTPDLQPGPTASRYGATKAAGDALALRLGAQLGVGVCVVQLACVVGRDPKLLSPQDDVMRMLPLVKGQVPATIAGSTIYTYVDVGDAARAIVRAAELGRDGARYFVGDQRLTTGDYYALLAELSGQPPPRASVPLWVARVWARLSAAWSDRVTGTPPQAPPDLINTVVAGTLLFDSSVADRDLRLPAYRPIREAFSEAVAFMLAATPTTAPGSSSSPIGPPSSAPAAAAVGAAAPPPPAPPLTVNDAPADAAGAGAAVGSGSSSSRGGGGGGGAEEGGAVDSSGRPQPPPPPPPPPPRVLRAHVALPWFDLLASGAKTVEGRLARGEWATLAPGDLLEFHNEEREGAPWRARVQGVRRYASFEAMLRDGGEGGGLLAAALPHPSVCSVEEGVAVYRRFYSAEEEEEWGALAVRVVAAEDWR